MTHASVVEVMGASRRFGDRAAVENVSFALAAGEGVALVGHNGAGKTTLMKMMLGLLRPSGGALTIHGADPAATPAARLLMGYLPENVAFGGALTGRETLRFYARLKDAPAMQIGALLERVGLDAAADRRVATYSKGMRQRLGLAQALLGAPRLLLLDEPTSGLDPQARRMLFELLRERRESGVTLLLSSHALGEIEGAVARLLIMKQGRLLVDSDVAELRRSAALPARLRVRLNDPAARLPPLPAGAHARRLGAVEFEIDLPASLRLEALRRLAQDESVADLETTPPSLDHIYAHVLAG